MKKLISMLCAFGLLVAVGISTPGCGKKDDKKTSTGTAPAPTTTKSGT